MLNSYDPESTPKPSEWLAIDEGERIELVLNYHRNARISLPKSARSMHAAVHVVVENQLALDDQDIVRATLQRLMQDGLSRHDAVHAVGSVLAQHIYDILQVGTASVDGSTYYEALQNLTVESWRQG